MFVEHVLIKATLDLDLRFGQEPLSLLHLVLRMVPRLVQRDEIGLSARDLFFDVRDVSDLLRQLLEIAQYSVQ